MFFDSGQARKIQLEKLFFRRSRRYWSSYFHLCGCRPLCPAAYANPVAAVADSTSASFPISKELGKMDESFQGSSGKTILFIQDAHDSLEAQEEYCKAHR